MRGRVVLLGAVWLGGCGAVRDRIDAWQHPEQVPPTDAQCRADVPSITCWVRVAGGTFRMGAQATDPAAPNHDPEALPDEGPVRDVTVRPFWILKYEVTGSTFSRCVNDGGCSAEDVAGEGGFSRWAATSVSGVGNLPINGISWDGARRLCAFIGGRLPTEAEWERAARGDDARRFPWGDEPGCGLITTSARYGSAATEEMRTSDCALGEPPLFHDLWGQGPYGTLGQAGSLWEWVEDAYDAEAYAKLPARNPRNTEGELRVQRGGGWLSNDPLELRSAARMAVQPDIKANDVGVRCVFGQGD